MVWRALIEMSMEHDYYAPDMPPISVAPADPGGFDRAGLLLRRSGALVVVLAEEGATDLPAQVVLDLRMTSVEGPGVTRAFSWHYVPQIHLPPGVDQAALSADHASKHEQIPGHKLLARITVNVTATDTRVVHLHFAATESHWAYHVMGPDHDDVIVEDPEGEVRFDPVGTVDVRGRAARVIRSRVALPAKARPGQRFSLSRPGPFGPRTIVPVLPAPAPEFSEVPGQDGTGPITQSNIYVTIF